MKKFAGKRPTKEIIAAARHQGVAVDDYNFRKNAMDHIAFGVASGRRPDGTPLVNPHANDRGWVFYNTFNGRFCGVSDKGVPFTSDSTKHENEPWFQALLHFFYVEKAAP